MAASWLALVIGNTRLHWGYFDRGLLSRIWHTPHLSEWVVDQIDSQSDWQQVWLLIEALTNQLVMPPSLDKSLPIELWLASVVPSQTRLWTQAIPDIKAVRRSHIPLKNVYPTLGIDRAINLLGAKQTLGCPVLVIDSGTALTLTAGVNSSVYGGAILPGMKLQLESLGQKTAELGSLLPTVSAIAQLQQDQPSETPPEERPKELPEKLPERWASNSGGAIASGIAYGLVSTCIDYITDWWQRFPTGAVVCTGGDGLLIHQYLQQRTPEIASRVLVDSDLMFRGMQAYRSELTM
ncbi:MAG: type III pantothenate kinase [Cyanobacteria bacterium P01_D01_bin.1]